ncbi:MAG: hypothetical protein AB8G99_09435 [Planctomycetaceae bacterium]
MSSYAEIKADTTNALASGEYESAFRSFQSAIDFRTQMLDGSESQFADAFGVFAQIAEHFAADEFVSQIRAVCGQPNDIQRLYDLGYALYEENLPGIGATVLARADELAPGTPAVVAELVTSLEACNSCHSAVGILRKYPELTSSAFLPAYQLAFNSAMCGDLNTLRESLSTLPQLSSGDENDEYMTQRIRDWVHRADQVGSVSALDNQDLRGWHYVTTGGVLTHLSPHGFPDPMCGRYAMLGDSPGRVHQGVIDLKRLANRYDWQPTSITPLDNRSSQIVGHAVARSLDLPLRSWTEEGSNSNTIVVAYDLSSFDDLTRYKNLREREPHQILFSHALCWVRSCPFAPDVVTLLHQYNTAPWDSQMRIDPDSNQTTQTEPDERAPEQIADDILSAEPESEGTDIADANAPALSDDLLDAIRPFPTATPTRENFWESSPVKSASFR